MSVDYQALNDHLENYSYIGGYAPTDLDLKILPYVALEAEPFNGLSSLLRWYLHISSFTLEEWKSFSDNKVLEEFSNLSFISKPPVEKVRVKRTQFFLLFFYLLG